jgi:hypothetical protein
MSVHPNDAAILRRLISLTLAVTGRPSAAAIYLADVIEIEADIAVAIRCAAPGRHVGTVEIALALILKRLAGEHIATTGEVLILAHTAQRLVDVVREHLFEAVAAGANRA